VVHVVTDSQLRPSLAETAYRVLQDRLLTLEIRPGDPLNDEALARDLGFGRTPVREALKRLEMDRLVVTYPRRGPGSPAGLALRAPPARHTRRTGPEIRGVPVKRERDP
jgi:hypothetical protein